MIEIIVQLLSSFLGGQLKIMADNQDIHDFEPYFQPCECASNVMYILLLELAPMCDND